MFDPNDQDICNYKRIQQLCEQHDIVMGVGLAVVAGGRHVRVLAAGDEWPHTGEGAKATSTDSPPKG